MSINVYAVCGIKWFYGFVSENKAVGVMKPGHAFTIEPMISEGNKLIISFIAN